MVSNVTHSPKEQISLRGRLSDIGEVPPWIAALGTRYAVPSDLQLSINLCLEEALSNIIRHGYGSDADRSVSVEFSAPQEGYFVFVVDDEAPRFNPLDTPELPALNPDESDRVGGQGIRLLRRFTDTIEYEPTPTGNRLRMGFSTAGTSFRAD